MTASFKDENNVPSPTSKKCKMSGKGKLGDGGSMFDDNIDKPCRTRKDDACWDLGRIGTFSELMHSQCSGCRKKCTCGCLSRSFNFFNEGPENWEDLKLLFGCNDDFNVPPVKKLFAGTKAGHGSNTTKTGQGSITRKTRSGFNANDPIEIFDSSTDKYGKKHNKDSQRHTN